MEAAEAAAAAGAEEEDWDEGEGDGEEEQEEQEQEEEEEEAQAGSSSGASSDGESSSAGGATGDAADVAAAMAAGGSGGAAAGGDGTSAQASAAAAEEVHPVISMPLSGLEEALRGCSTLACLQQAHMRSKHPQQFNFPHFLLLGFPKCATTSLYRHLIQHPTIMAPKYKEPHFFTRFCRQGAGGCQPEEEASYINETLHLGIALQARLFMASFEASTHYSLEGEWLAPKLARDLPWLKLVLSLREPISRWISMLKHNLDNGRVPACYKLSAGAAYPCIRRKLEQREQGYAPRLRAWATAFPPEQLYVLQYENLTSEGVTRKALRDIKRFVGVDPNLPNNDLGLYNSRRSETEGWPMTRKEYARLVELARRDAQEVVELVRQHGWADADRWLEAWEEAWAANLEACRPGPRGACSIQLT
ncbi:sulfotransferase [Micractinium conductrix]|uniref:Sulfotransferase n=1 Tax=Micractinium conductrix TaxID=554055 RepID=A0A2P6V323_9CHLO|nr:sulfotransferase [Micractinium conductrix]|eukprot:PSC68491.1 sulfotransferase [Micractinium conductrix]